MVVNSTPGFLIKIRITPRPRPPAPISAIAMRSLAPRTRDQERAVKNPSPVAPIPAMKWRRFMLLPIVSLPPLFLYDLPCEVNADGRGKSSGKGFALDAGRPYTHAWSDQRSAEGPCQFRQASNTPRTSDKSLPGA